jgi:hypothetical protein
MANNNLRNANNPTYNGALHAFGMGGYAAVSFQIVGTISAGSYTPQVSDDGATWISVSCYTSDNALVSTVTAAGMYRVDVNGYQVFRLLPSGDFSGNCAVSSFAAAQPLAPYGAAGGGGVPVPTPSSLGPIPYDFKYTFSHTNFQAAAFSAQANILTLPVRGKISGVLICPTVAFIGSGPFTSYMLGIGIASTPDLYLPYSDATTISGSPFFGDMGLSVPSMSATTVIQIGALATGALLNTSTAGSVDVYLTLSKLPA